MKLFCSNWKTATARARTWAGVGLLGLLAGITQAVTPASPAPGWPLANLPSLPFSFEQNQGQAAARYPFLASGRGCVLLFAPDEVLIGVGQAREAARVSSAASRVTRGHVSEPMTVRTVRIQLPGASRFAMGQGMDPLPGRVNYFLGNDPAAWQRNVPMFARVQFREVYPGVDVIYYGNDRQLEFDFVVAPGADARPIAFEIGGASRLELDQAGDLIIHAAGEQFRQHRPVAYQHRDGQRVLVASRYRLAGNRRVEFELGRYDAARPLVIDPVLGYSSYFGGSGLDRAWDIATDAAGFVYIAGETMSAQLAATAGAFQTNYGGGSTAGGDAFVAKLKTDGASLVYLTYLGGKTHDGALGLALGTSGSAYLTGFTGSSDFPTKLALQTNIAGKYVPSLNAYPLDGFVTKLDPGGSNLVYSTFLGGNELDEGIGIAADPAGSAYVTGLTESTNFPTTTNAVLRSLQGGQDAFVAKLNPAGSAFIYATYLGGTNADNGDGVAADIAGFAYVTGFTSSTNFFTTNALQTRLNNTTNLNLASDVFVAKFPPTDGTPLYSTFLGGVRDEVGFRVAADAAGNAFVAGATASQDFPVTATNLPNGLSGTVNLADVFVAKLSASGATNLYSVVFGGSSSDEAWDLAVDTLGQVYVTGLSFSTDFPVSNPPAAAFATNHGSADAFVAVLDPTAAGLPTSFYLGGRAEDYGYGIDVDPAGNICVAGSTVSSNFPVHHALQPVFAGGPSDDAFLAKFLNQPALSIGRSDGSVVLAWPAPAPEFLLEENTNLNTTNWVPAGGLPALSNGFHRVTLDPTNAAALFRLRLP